MKYIVPLAVIALIVIAAVFFFNQNNTQSQSEQITLPTGTQQTQEITEPNQAEVVSNEYTDGTYTAQGNYVSPGGPRSVDVTIVLEEGVITDSTFVGGADDPTSQRFQGEFAANYQPMVVGKNIDEVDLTKVSGSSLTPQGFMDAITTIKEQAQS